MEKSCYIAYISYLIEKWLYMGDVKEEILQRIDSGKRKHRFPVELEYLDSYLDPKYGSSGCAFFDREKNKVLAGFAGTNYRNGIIEGTKDMLTDAILLGVTGMGPQCEYLKEPQKFMDGLKAEGSGVNEVTGHSLGGALAAYIGIYNDISRVVTYNGAPLYLVSLGDKNEIDEYVKNYTGSIIRYVSSDDPLNNITAKTHGFYPGELRVIEETTGHAMINFIRAFGESEF